MRALTLTLVASPPVSYRVVAEKSAIAECKAWLVENGYPDFGNAAAYWDAP